MKGKLKLHNTVFTEGDHKAEGQFTPDQVVKGLSIRNEATRGHAGLTKTDGSQRRVLIKCGPLEEEKANQSSISVRRTPRTVRKDKKI